MTQVSDTCVRITGRSYLGAVNNAAIAGGNAIGLLYDVNPSLLGDRVAVMAGTYDKYCYQSMKFTYVPQCPTTQPGSVMLVFERDAEAQCANTTSASFMQEVMSYEHAVLTPAWVTTSVTYKRDPHEVKTWFMGGDTANLTSRETSQGSFIAYTSNASVQSSPGASGKLGFIVMDFVLDLVSPNILPNKTRNLGGQQYVAYPNFGLTNPSTLAMTAGNYQQQFFLNNFAFGYHPGTIVEVVIDGTAGSNANNGQSITNFLCAFSGGAVTPQQLTPPLLPSGARFYLSALQSYDPTGPGGNNTGVPGSVVIWYASATLADAIGLLGSAPGIQVNNASVLQSTREYQLMSTGLACRADLWGALNIISNQNAFVRVLTSPQLGSTA